MGIITRLFGGIWSYVAGFFAVVATLGAIYAKGRADAKVSAEHEANLEKIKAMKAKKDIDDEVSKLGRVDLDKRASRWLRND